MFTVHGSRFTVWGGQPSSPRRLCASAGPTAGRRAPLRSRAVLSQLSALSTQLSPRGIVYPLLLGSILIIGVATAGVAELWSTQIKRDKEEELLFRLGEIRRAIVRYRADHNRLPKELKDLLEDKTQLQIRRYLRRIYPDPMTGKADWDLKLVVDRAGVVSGIEDVHSKSTGKPLRLLSGKPTQGVTYKDW